MDTRGQKRPRRITSQPGNNIILDISTPANEANITASNSGQLKLQAKKDMSEKSGIVKKRRTPPGLSDDESRQEKKVKVELETRKQRTFTRATRQRNLNGDEEIPSGTASKVTADAGSEHGMATTDDEKTKEMKSSTIRTKRNASSKGTKQEKDAGTFVDTESRANRKRLSHEGPKLATIKMRGASHSKGNEVDFGHHWRSNKGLSFNTATRVLMMTLKSAKHLDLAEENMQICADCRGGGDLLCCDCCPLAFHADCLEPLERPASLYVPIPKHGLKSMLQTPANKDHCKASDGNHEAIEEPRNVGLRTLEVEVSEEERYRLRETEWFCPYCLSHPILKLWKRGVPQLLTFFEGFSGMEYNETHSWRTLEGPIKSQEIATATTSDPPITEDEDLASAHARNTKNQATGNVEDWMGEVEKFVSDLHDSKTLFPPRILLALSGIRRALQRHGALYSAVSKYEQELSCQNEILSSDNVIASPPEVLPLAETEEPAEPSVAVKAEMVIKAPIMARRSSMQSVKSDDEQGNTAAKLGREAPPRRSTRRAQALAERKALAASKGPIKPVVKEKETLPDYEEAPIVQAKINVGATFQVPGVNRHFLEAREFGLDYLLFDKRSVCAYLPMDHMGRVPTARLHLGSGCRLVYSATELTKRQARIRKLQENISIRKTKTSLSHVPLTDEQLTEFTRQVISLWPVWIQWPPTQEFALKLLHHCRYDAKAALKLLCSDALQFRAVCDPPAKPYMNKWRPRDRRGHLPSIPFPPPSNSIALMGVGRSQTCYSKTEGDT